MSDPLDGPRGSIISQPRENVAVQVDCYGGMPAMNALSYGPSASSSDQGGKSHSMDVLPFYL